MRRIAFLFLLFPFALSAQEDCQLFNIQGLASENLALHDSIAQFSVDTVILQPDGSFEVQLSNGTTFTQVQGCTNPAYTEYNAAANTDDGSCATVVVEGCTDPAYTEYNAAANTDDGSCATLVVEGCTDPGFTEYDASANTDDGSCATLLGCTDLAYLEYDAAAGADDGSCATLLGCTDLAYLEYDAAAGADDGSCATLIVEGCTDSAADNYDAAVNVDDGSCLYYGCTDSAYLEYNGSANTDDGSCATLIVEGCTDSAYLEYNGSANTDDGSCATLIVEGCTDSAYLEYNGSANTDDGSCATLLGCTDLAYLEYDAAAGADDGSCATLIVEGCTDSAADNYDAAVNVDDGSCLYYGCTDSAYLEYNGSANTDDGSCAILVGCSESDVVSMDGVDYGVVTIGDQCWFTTNLRTTVYANGNSIAEIGNDDSFDVLWAVAAYGARCVYPDDLGGVISLNTYGRLYNWYAVDDSRGLCPSGWHVPTDGEWMVLEMELGMSESEANSTGWRGTDEGTQLKSTYGWQYGQYGGNGTDDFGFRALPGGLRSSSSLGSFLYAGDSGYWWSSSSYGGYAWRRDVYYDNPAIFRESSDPRSGFSVRCLRDAE